jgi:DNA invertase Pin-like site-specific DNA recombinase
VSTTRFAFYGRLSTDDRQDVTLARPSQLEACVRKVTELGGEVTAEFFDQASGARDDRLSWTALTIEARDRATRRFDGVVIYQTSRLSRDRVSAGLFERELRKVGVSVVYALGAGDPDTAEGKLLIALQQGFDEYERSKIKRETRHGMKQNTLNGYRNGGRTGGHTYLFTGMVKCASGHAPLAMHGRQRSKPNKTYTYMTCDYGRTYGREAAEQIDGHGQWLSIPENVLLPLVERFFQQRVFGPMRMQKLARQLDAHGKRSHKEARDEQTRMRRQVADLDHAIDHHRDRRGHAPRRRRPPIGGLGSPTERHSGGRIRTCDLRVMSPTSYQTAPPRVAIPCSSKKRGRQRPIC